MNRKLYEICKDYATKIHVGLPLTVDNVLNAVVDWVGETPVDQIGDLREQINQINAELPSLGDEYIGYKIVVNESGNAMKAVPDTLHLAKISSINLVDNNVIVSLTYDTTHGISMVTEGSVIYNDGQIENIHVEHEIPIVAGAGVSIDATEDNKKIEIKATGVDVVIDPQPTANSTNAVSSGGVYSALQGKLNANRQSVSTVGGLVKPLTTPTNTELVGISPAMEQERVKIGSGLSYDNTTNTLSASGGGGGGGTNVVANPSATTSGNLDSIQIGSTAYSLDYLPSTKLSGVVEMYTVSKPTNFTNSTSLNDVVLNGVVRAGYTQGDSGQFLTSKGDGTVEWITPDFMPAVLNGDYYVVDNPTKLKSRTFVDDLHIDGVIFDADGVVGSEGQFLSANSDGYPMWVTPDFLPAIKLSGAVEMYTVSDPTNFTNSTSLNDVVLNGVVRVGETQGTAGQVLTAKADGTVEWKGGYKISALAVGADTIDIMIDEV